MFCKVQTLLIVDREVGNAKGKNRNRIREIEGGVQKQRREEKVIVVLGLLLC